MGNINQTLLDIELAQRQEDIYELEQGLAAAQAREKVLRVALKEVSEYWVSSANAGTMLAASQYVVSTVEKALSPSDDSALKALLAAERVRVYEAVDRELEPRVSHAIRGIIKDAVERLGD